MPPTALARRPREHGTGRQPCSQRPCAFRSLPGLVRGHGHCPYHWAVRSWGRKWADSIYLPADTAATPAAPAPRSRR